VIHDCTEISKYAAILSKTASYHAIISSKPTQISRFGPARNMWAMRMEAKNGKFKTKKWNNFKNLPYSLSQFHQQSMCYEQTTGSGNYHYMVMLWTDRWLGSGKDLH